MDHAAIINLFGGIRPLAKALGHDHPTKVYGWKDRNNIPMEHWPALLKLAKKKGKALTREDFLPPYLREAS